MIHLIGGEKGGVGKSMTARILCQLLIDRQTSFRAFDADRSHPTLSRYYGDFCEPVDTNVFDDLDRIVTALEAGPQTIVVDLPAQSDHRLYRWLNESGVAELCAELGFRLVRWHVMDDGKDSLNLLASLMGNPLPETDYVIAQNLGRGREFDWINASPITAKALRMGAKRVQIPELHASTMSKIDRIDASFWAAVHNEDESLGPCLNVVERSRVKVWLRRAYEEMGRAHPSLAPERPPVVVQAQTAGDDGGR